MSAHCFLFALGAGKNSRLKSFLSDLRNVLRAKDESDDEEEEDSEGVFASHHWKRKTEEEEEEEESSSRDVPDGIGPNSFIRASIQNPAVASSLKGELPTFRNVLCARWTQISFCLHFQTQTLTRRCLDMDLRGSCRQTAAMMMTWK